jgi:hypothetical protein
MKTILFTLAALTLCSAAQTPPPKAPPSTPNVITTPKPAPTPKPPTTIPNYVSVQEAVERTAPKPATRSIGASVASEVPMITVTFEWDPNPEPDVHNYKLIWGNSESTMTESTLVQATTTTIGLPDGALYYAAVIAVDDRGVESLPSDTLIFRLGKPGRPNKPRIKIVIQ